MKTIAKKAKQMEAMLLLLFLLIYFAIAFLWYWINIKHFNPFWSISVGCFWSSLLFYYRGRTEEEESYIQMKTKHRGKINVWHRNAFRLIDLRTFMTLLYYYYIVWHLIRMIKALVKILQSCYCLMSQHYGSVC